MNNFSWFMHLIRSIYQHLWLRRNYPTRTFILVIFFLLIGRSLPYFAPIKAKDIQQNEQALEFNDRNGQPLGTLLTQNQEHTAVVALDKISPNFLNAILAAEDGDFYQHGAVEIKAIVRAIVQAIEAKRIVSGGSTITMQLARMLEPEAPRNLNSKAQEVWLSWRLTAGMSKDEILTAYVNRLPMGGNIYGVEAASRIYFDIPANELNIAQASLLASIPNNPNHLNPYTSWENLKTRQRYVLDRLVAEGYITTIQAQSAYQEKIPLQPRQQGIIAAPHFLFWVAEQQSKQQSSPIQTTIDLELQQFVETQARQIVKNLAPLNVTQASVLVIDNHTGEVLAYVGSIDYFSPAQFGSNDGVQALRQPGSTLKPFLYQLALEKKVIRPNSILADIPTYYAIPDAKIYSPNDYSETFAGPVRVRVALANSLNIPAVRVLEKVGVSSFLTRLQKLGFQNLDRSAEYYGLGLTLGSGEVSLWQLANSYRTIALQGKMSPLVTTIDSSSQSQSESINNKKTENTLPTDSQTWLLITDMLNDRHARSQEFGVDSILNLPFPTAVKTGTSSNFRDTWTVGFSTDYTVATWVGNFDGEPMQQVSGIAGAAQLWNRIMLRLHQDNFPRSFSKPEKMVLRPICALSGLKPTPICPSVVQEYFYPEDLPEYENNPDTFYQAIPSTTKANSPQYFLNLPPEYDRWLASQNRSDSNLPLSLRILSPRDGDRLLLDETDKQGQKLIFQVSASSTETIQWRLNGKILANNSPSFAWQIRPGNWTLEVKVGEMSDRVSFKVDLAQPKIDRRGFSLGNK